MTIILVIALPLAMPLFSTFSTTHITINVDGQTVHFQDQNPVIVENRTLVPIRGVFEIMDFDIYWDYNNRIVRLTSATHIIVIPADVPHFVVNGEIVTPEVPQRLINNRLMLPLRAIAEATGATAYWDPNGRVADIVTLNHGNGHQAPAHTPQPSTPSTISEYVLHNRPTNNSLFNIEIFRVHDGTIVSEWRRAYGCVDYVFAIWQEENNAYNVNLVDSVVLIRWALGVIMDVGLNVSPESYSYFRGEDGLLLAESLARTFEGMWRPRDGSIRFVLFISDTPITLLPQQENALFFRDTIVTSHDYPH